MSIAQTQCQQKTPPIPHNLQYDVQNELDQLIKLGHIERLKTIDEHCCFYTHKWFRNIMICIALFLQIPPTLLPGLPQLTSNTRFT